MRYGLLCGVLALFLVTGSATAFYGARFEPPDGTIYHGCGWNGYESQALYAGMFPSGHQPLVLQVVWDMPGTRPVNVPLLVRALTEPVVHADSQFIEFGVHFRDRFGMLDSVFARTTTLDHYMDTLAAAFLEVNRPFFLRIGFEFNGDWNPYHPYIFPEAFRKLVTGLRERGVTNFATVWCYEPDAPSDFADSTVSGWKWYPGDDFVDWFGLDPFDQEHFNPALPDSSRGEITRKGKSELFLRFAETRHKPVYLNELSAQHTFIVPDSADSNYTEGQADWELWFVPFFQFVRNHPAIKGWNYINLDWTHYETYETWGDARLEINSYIRERWVDSLTEARFLNAGYDITMPVDAPRAVAALPVRLTLHAYPNPFNAAVRLRFENPRPQRLELVAFDVLGRQIWSSGARDVTAGAAEWNWEPAGVASGLYFLALQDDDGVRSAAVKAALIR